MNELCEYIYSAMDQLDITELAIVDIYLQHICSPTIQSQRVLGFEVDHRIFNFSNLSNSCEFETTSISIQHIPGTLLVECVNLVLESKSIEIVDTVNMYPMDISNIHSVQGLIYPGILYDGTHVFIKCLFDYYDSTYTIEQYVKIVLLLYREITKTRMGLNSHSWESVSYIQKIEMNTYAPTTNSYTEFLSKVSDAFTLDLDVTINPKYDGAANWIYVSSTVPPSLISQYRSRNSNQHKYVGRMCKHEPITFDDCYAILVERIQIVEEVTFVATDCFTNVKMDYHKRRRTLEHVMHTLGLAELLKEVGNNIFITESTFYRCSGDNNKENVLHISQAISKAYEYMDIIDGIVVYIGDDRPAKIKLCNMVTVDVECTIVDKDNTLSKRWSTSNKYLLQKLEKGSKNLHLPEHNKEYVLEMSVHDGTIKRHRPDRLRGNPEPVINNIVQKYMKDEKYSTVNMWRIEDIRFPILVNRMFKRHCYIKHIPCNSNVIDLGSGNGADAFMWSERGYKVLAIEQDKERFSVLKRRVSTNHKVIPRCDDMSNVISILSKQVMLYKYVCFMRSIGHLSLSTIKNLINNLRVYGVHTIMIVTMVRDNLHNFNITDSLGQRFTIQMDSTPSGVTVDYTVGSINNPKSCTYKDNCYLLSDWKLIADQCNYDIEYTASSDYVKGAYGIQELEIMYPSLTDYCLVLTRRK